MKRGRPTKSGQNDKVGALVSSLRQNAQLHTP